MMPHEVCQHSGCWLKSFSMPEGITPPLYRFYQHVEVITSFEVDEEHPCHRCDRGVIVGAVYNHPHFSYQGWIYTVRFSTREELISSPWLSLPFDEEVPESEIRAI